MTISDQGWAAIQAYESAKASAADARENAQCFAMKLMVEHPEDVEIQNMIYIAIGTFIWGTACFAGVAAVEKSKGKSGMSNVFMALIAANATAYLIYRAVHP